MEPVFSKSGETIGINYMGMDVTDQVTLFFPRGQSESPSFTYAILIDVPCCTIGKKTGEDGKASRGDSSTKSQGNRTKQNNSYNRFTCREFYDVVCFTSCASGILTFNLIVPL